MKKSQICDNEVWQLINSILKWYGNNEGKPYDQTVLNFSTVIFVPGMPTCMQKKLNVILIDRINYDCIF